MVLSCAGVRESFANTVIFLTTLIKSDQNHINETIKEVIVRFANADSITFVQTSRFTQSHCKTIKYLFAICTLFAPPPPQKSFTFVFISSGSCSRASWNWRQCSPNFFLFYSGEGQTRCIIGDVSMNNLHIRQYGSVPARSLLWNQTNILKSSIAKFLYYHNWFEGPGHLEDTLPYVFLQQLLSANRWQQSHPRYLIWRKKMHSAVMERISNYWMRLSRMCRIVFRDLHNLGYHTKAEFNNCFIIHSRYFKINS